MTVLFEEIRAQASARWMSGSRKFRIVLGDAADVRILEAARLAIDRGMSDVIFVGDRNKIQEQANNSRISLEGADILTSGTFPHIDEIAKNYFDRRKDKIPSFADALEEIRSNDLLFGAALVGSGYADGMLAGSISTTGEVIRAALKGIGLAEGVSTLSSMFLFAFPPIAGLREKEFSAAFADAAVLVDPTAEQLADVAIETAKTYRALTGNEPHVAMLSFSTKGSATSESTEKMVHATKLAQEKAPTLSIDGELQFDAAFVPAVAARKASGSNVAGRANVFIFPNLDAGNISYKIAERLGRGEATGPILQGLRKPMNDLSRGASVSDILNMIAVTGLQGGNV